MHPTEKQTLRQHRLLVAFTALAASIAGVRNDFAYDDILVILHDDRIVDLGRWLEFLTTPYWAAPHSADLYRPLASLSLALQYVIGAGGPLVFRLVSIMLYALAALLVFALASRVMSRGAALAAGVLFAAHPVHVEAVVQGVNQGELLVAIFSLVAVCRYVDKRRAGSLDASDWRVLAVLYGLAVLTKENGFVLPGLLVAAELFLVHDKPVAERIGALWRGYAMLGAVAVVLVIVRVFVLSGDVVGAFTAEALVGLSLGGRMFTMLQVVPTWLRLLSVAGASADRLLAERDRGVVQLRTARGAGARIDRRSGRRHVSGAPSRARHQLRPRMVRRRAVSGEQHRSNEYRAGRTNVVPAECGFSHRGWRARRSGRANRAHLGGAALCARRAVRGVHEFSV